MQYFSKKVSALERDKLFLFEDNVTVSIENFKESIGKLLELARDVDKIHLQKSIAFT